MKQRLITIAAGLVTLIAAVMWVAQGREPSASAAGATQLARPSPSSTSIHEPAAAGTGPPPGLAGGGLVSYALPITELQGFPPDLAPGTMIDLWVLWQPPVTKRPKVDRLLEGVVFEKIVPPLLPDGPHAAVFLVSNDEISDLIWGDRLGALSAAVPARGEDRQD